jgi:hypothetical protein
MDVWVDDRFGHLTEAACHRDGCNHVGEYVKCESAGGTV